MKHPPRGGPVTGAAVIEGLAHDGRGVARVEGKTLFVSGALPGEEVRFRIERRHARYDEARIEELLHAAPERCAPPCPHYGSCGGCNLQHLDPRAQLAHKESQLASTLQRLGHLQPARWLEAVASTAWGYRARARLAITREPGTGHVRLGFRREASREVEALEQCPVLDPELSRLLAPLAQVLEQCECAGNLRETWLARGDTGSALALGCTTAPGSADLQRLQSFCATQRLGFEFGVATRGGEYAWDPAAATLEYAPAEGIRIGFAPWQFTQANPAVNRALVARVLDLLEPLESDTALDLFCGLGNFSLPLSRRVRSVTGIEGEAALVARAQANATANGIANVRFLRDDLARPPGQVAWARERYDVVILDPPRTGAIGLMKLLPRFRSRHICYVSCDAATLARDAAQLATAGWKLEAAGVLDMFPQTAHFETLALFRH